MSDKTEVEPDLEAQLYEVTVTMNAMVQTDTEISIPVEENTYEMDGKKVIGTIEFSYIVEAPCGSSACEAVKTVANDTETELRRATRQSDDINGEIKGSYTLEASKVEN
jgi:hypothetical protein